MNDDIVKRLDDINRLHVSQVYKLVLAELRNQPDFTIHHDAIQRKDNRGPSPIIGTPIPGQQLAPPSQDAWPKSLNQKVQGLISFKAIPLDINIGPMLAVVVTFPAVEELKHSAFSDIIRRKKPGMYARYPDRVDPASPYYWPDISWDEKTCLQQQLAEMPDHCTTSVRLKVWENTRQIDACWNMRNQAVGEFIDDLKAKEKIYTKLIKTVKTRKDIEAAFKKRYQKEVWTPRLAWYLGLTADNRKIVTT